MTPPLTRNQANMAELRDQLAQMRATNAALLAQLGQQPARLAPAPSQPRPVLPLPSRFSGAASECANFVVKLQLLFSVYPTIYPTSPTKCGLLVSLLDGTAADWAARELRETPTLLDHFQTLLDRFVLAFDDHEREFKAQHRIMSIRQGGRSVAAYALEFRQLALHTAWDVAALLAHFLHGLKDDIQDLLLALPSPTSIDQAVTQATACEVRLQARARNRGPLSQAAQRQPQQPQQSQPRGPLSQAEKDRRRNLNLCAYCGDAAHHQADCPRRRDRFVGAPGGPPPAQAARGPAPLRLAAAAVDALDAQDDVPAQGNGLAQQ